MGKVGDCGLRERGEENVRVGRGRGVLKIVVALVSESEEDDITDAFLLKSARVGGKVGAGGCPVVSTLSIIQSPFAGVSSH
jgi:hypothetical protein